MKLKLRFIFNLWPLSRTLTYYSIDCKNIIKIPPPQDLLNKTKFKENVLTFENKFSLWRSGDIWGDDIANLLDPNFIELTIIAFADALKE